MAPTVEKRGPGRPPGSKNKAKPAAKPPVIDDGMDDDDDGGIEEVDELEDLDEVDEPEDLDEAEEPDDEDLNLPKDFVEDALRSAPKKAPLKPEPIPEKTSKAQADGTSSDGKELKVLAGQIAALTTVVGGLEEKITGPGGFGSQSSFGATHANRLNDKITELHKKVDALIGNLSAMEAYLADALGDNSKKTAAPQGAIKRKADEEEKAVKKGGISPEDKQKLTKYIAATFRTLKAGKKYALKSVVALAQERLGVEIATPSRVQGLLEEHGIKIVSASEGIFSIISEDE